MVLTLRLHCRLDSLKDYIDVISAPPNLPPLAQDELQQKRTRAATRAYVGHTRVEMPP